MELTNELIKGLFGVEIEEHRVDVNSKTLSQSKHNQELGDRRTQPYFQTDFSESMEELITSPQPTIQKSYDQLHNLQKILQNHLKQNEIIWPFSMPPKLKQVDLDYLENNFERDWYAEYRETLIKKYGLFQHIMCGIHVSYSPTKKIVLKYQKEQQISDYQTAKNELLFKIARQLVGYRWLITYLFGAAIQDFNKNNNIPTEIKKEHAYVKSWRSSQYGFANQQNIDVSYDDFASFEDSLNGYVNDKTLFAKSEFYGPVRLKTLKGNPESQIDYLEFRMLDDNPFSPEGLDIRTLYFIHLLVIDSVINLNSWTKKELQANDSYNNVVALSAPNSKLHPNYELKANQLINRLKAIAKQIDNDKYTEAVNWINEMIKDPTNTIAGRLFNLNGGEQLGLRLGLSYKETLRKQAFWNVPSYLSSLYEKIMCNGDLIEEINHDSIKIKEIDETLK